MNPLIASLIYACGIAGLFYLDRDKSVRTSKALWLPVVYLLVLGSRPVSVWLGIGPPAGSDVQLDGSPLDRLFFAALILGAIGVLIYRGRRVWPFVKSNGPILVYFLFCLVSVVWSSFPGVALKRWVKATGDVAMILVVITDPRPIAALRRFFSRTGFVLIPLSLLFIKYYPQYGRGYDAWSGMPSNFGVALNKNVLGVTTFVLLLGALWHIVSLLKSDQNTADRRRHLLAQGALLALGIYLLAFANSDTSSVSFALGAGILLATSMRFFRRNPASVHVLVLALLATMCWAMLLGGEASIAHALGRRANLTGRTDIWAAVIPMVPNPVVGAGFESFWLSPQVKKTLWQIFPNLPLNEAHNGYIEVYLELGWIGVGLIALILIDGYRRTVKAFRREPTLGGLLIAYVLSATAYSLTEAGFRMMDPIWIFLMLAIVQASGIAAGAQATDQRETFAGAAPALVGRNALTMIPDRKAAIATPAGGIPSSRPEPTGRSNPGTESRSRSHSVPLSCGTRGR